MTIHASVFAISSSVSPSRRDALAFRVEKHLPEQSLSLCEEGSSASHPLSVCSGVVWSQTIVHLLFHQRRQCDAQAFLPLRWKVAREDCTVELPQVRKNLI